MRALFVQVWEACSDAAISFSNHDKGQPLSTIIENDLIQKALNSLLDDSSNNLDIIYGAKVTEYSLPDRSLDPLPSARVTVKLDSGHSIQTNLLIGSDGNRLVYATF